MSKTQSTSSTPPPHHQRASAEFDLSEQKLSQPVSNFEVRGRTPSQQSSNKSRSLFNDDEHQSKSVLPRYVSLYRKRSKSNPLARQASQEHRRHIWKSNHSRTNSNRSRLSASSQGVYRVDRHRRKALKLLIVIIFAFFICWTPIFLFHTFGTFDKKFYRSMPTIFVDVILLFSFASPLCNPFTYYFMSKRYRAVLYAYLSCCSSKKNREKFHNKKSQEAQQVVKALHLHQQQNSLEYKQKINQMNFSSQNYSRHYLKSRSSTLQ